MVELWVCRLGTIPYLEADRRCSNGSRSGVCADEIPDVPACCSSTLPLFTRGRRSRDDELPLGEDFYSARGVR